VFTARYAPSPYIKQIRFVFKGLTWAEGGGRLNSVDFSTLVALQSQLLSCSILSSYSAESLSAPLPYLRVANAASPFSRLKWKCRPQTPAVVSISITALQKDGFIFWYFYSPLFLLTETTFYIFLELTGIKFHDTPRPVDVWCLISGLCRRHSVDSISA
jgi:hypothetical protein